MANTKYNEGRAATANKLVDYDSDTFTAIFVDSTYVFDVDDAFAALSGTDLDTATMTGLAIGTDGSITSDPIVWTGLAVAEDPIAFVIRDTTAGKLIGYVDTLAASTPIEGTILGDGTNVTINPPAEGWLRI